MVPEIDQQQLAQVRAAAAVMVVDVREADEYRGGHVPGARLIPLKVLGARMHELPRDIPVYLVCQSGGRSAQATRMLLGAGIRAVNVRGGTAAWIQARSARRARHRDGGDTMIDILTIETTGLGDRSYLAHDGRVALVVDPQRDIDRVLAVAADAGVTITHVFETHIHNDYVTGGLALAQATDAAYLLNADDDVTFERTGLHDGDVVTISAAMAVRALHTPGHTHTHLSYALMDAAGDPIAVFSGGSLLFGATGRPDLLGPDHTDTLVRAQWHSAHRLATELPGAATLHPTHGFGSFCSASGTVSGTAGTIGDETRTNPALTLDEEHYVRDLLAGLDAFPAYYAHMAPANSAGPDAPDLTPPAVADAGELRRRIDAGEWVVDLRDGTAFAAGHVTGSVNVGLAGQFVTYLGWLIPWGTPVTLLGDTAVQVADAQRELVRIGIDRPAAMATGGPADWTDAPVAFRRATFTDLADVLATGDDPAVLDVRRTSERATAAIVGSVHIPIHEILTRLDEVPAATVWVHCAGGYRASIVASLLHARGHDVVAVDDDFAQAVAAGLTASTDRAAAWAS